MILKTSNAICSGEANMNLYFQVWLMYKTYSWHCGLSYWNWINIFVGFLSLTFYTLCQCKPQINNINRLTLVNKNWFIDLKVSYFVAKFMTKVIDQELIRIETQHQYIYCIRSKTSYSSNTCINNEGIQK